MTFRVLSVREPYVSDIESGRKTIEIRSYRIKPGPLVIAASAFGGASAELRCLVDVQESRDLDEDDWQAAGVDEDWCFNNAGTYTAIVLVNVRRLVRVSVKAACVNCAAGRRDTHAGIYSALDTQVRLLSGNIAAREPTPVYRRQAPQIPQPIAAELREAIAAFGDTAEVRKLFGG